MLKRFRIWCDTRWFMKHWQINRETARYFAAKRNP